MERSNITMYLVLELEDMAGGNWRELQPCFLIQMLEQVLSLAHDLKLFASLPDGLVSKSVHHSCMEVFKVASNVE